MGYPAFFRRQFPQNGGVDRFFFFEGNYFLQGRRSHFFIKRGFFMIKNPIHPEQILCKCFVFSEIVINVPFSFYRCNGSIGGDPGFRSVTRNARSEERSEGQECVRTCRSRRSQYNKKKKK